MKTLFLLLTVFILSFETSAQINFRFDNKLKTKNTAVNLYETPFHIGINYSLLSEITDTGNDETFHALWGYYDFNLGGKIVFGQFEFGGFSDEGFHGGAMFSSLGLKFKAVNFNRHIIYLSTGMMGFWGHGAAGFTAFISPRYVFAIAKCFGISAGLRYMHRIGFPQRFLVGSIGVQLFIK